METVVRDVRRDSWELRLVLLARFIPQKVWNLEVQMGSDELNSLVGWSICKGGKEEHEVRLRSSSDRLGNIGPSKEYEIRKGEVESV
jgi:hypothetical protein